MQRSATAHTPLAATLRQHVARHAHADDPLAWREFASTFLAYAGALSASTWFLGMLRRAEDWGQRVALGLGSALALIALVGAMVRAFLLRHDLCHRGYFSSRALSRVVAPLAGTLVSTSPSGTDDRLPRSATQAPNLRRLAS